MVAFKIDVDDKNFVDNEELDVKELLKEMKNSPNPVKTSCPSPGDFLEEYEGQEDTFVVTISGELSGTYSSANLAKNMIKEKRKDKFIHVFNSKSASVGETLVALKIRDLIEGGESREKIVLKTEEYISNLRTFFILENLDNLIKNGRISKTKGLIANVLNLKPIMKANERGEIVLGENIRGRKKAFKRLVQMIGETGDDFKNKVIGIAHCNAPEKAYELKKEISEKYNFKDIIVVETGGLTTAYANDGGVVIVF